MHKHPGFPLAMSAMAITTGLSALLLLGGCNKAPQDTLYGASAASATSAASDHVTDREVTEHVTMALKQNDRLKGYDIAVVTLKGDVRLSGALNTQTDIDEAIRIARAAEGTHTIHDELTLKK